MKHEKTEARPLYCLTTKERPISIQLTRRVFIASGLATCATLANAQARAYELVVARSRITFYFTSNGLRQAGTVPVATAEISVDTQNLARSTAEVTADIRSVSSKVVFVTQAIKSADLLDAANHPIVRFKSTRIQLGRAGRISEGATIEGSLTLRGITNSIVLNAALTRPAGTSPDDLSVLNIKLNGTLSRTAFGAVGFAGLAEDQVDLDIQAEIQERA